MPNWDDVKKRIDGALEPSSERTLECIPYGEGSHGDEKKKHNLKKYSLNLMRFPKELTLKADVEVFFQWAVCPDCGVVRWKKFIGFNNKENVVHERYLVRYGKPIENDPFIKEIVKEMF